MNTKNKKLSVWQILFLVFLIVGTGWILFGNRDKLSFRESSGKIFGTYYKVKYEHTDAVDSLILYKLREVDQSLSMFNSESVITKINSNLDNHADSLLTNVFLLSNEISKQTSGAFDVTVAPLVNAWGFGFKNADTVSTEQVDSIMNFVGYDKVSIKDGVIVKSDPRIMMDFSAVAKGYGVDCVARLFDSLGVKNYLVEIGGEIVVKGQNPRGKKWTIEVTRPQENQDKTVHSKILLDVTDMAMATSGNYRRFYYKNGKRYAHTIDSHTGYPVQHSLLSATVLAKDCATADAYATAFMVMGVEKTQEFLSAHPELSAYLIFSGENDSLSTWASPGMAGYMKK